jgi:CRISPR-associated protein Csb1
MTQRQYFNIELESIPTPRFQPTGFPDLGAAEFDAFDRDRNAWVPCLLVESPQSMANRAEAVGWIEDGDDSGPVPTLEGLPYIRVVAADDGRFLASSRTEAHRLASAFILDATEAGTSMRDRLPGELRLRANTPVDHATVARAVFDLDPLCLLHGVFFAQKSWTAQPKIARAVTAVIEAVDVRKAHSGGVKFDEVQRTVQEGSGTAEGYGTVPHHREEFTAAQIWLRWSLDRAQLRSYRLSDEATELLEAVAHWQLAALVDEGLRLRTACEFKVIGGAPRDSEGASLGSTELLGSRVQDLIGRCPELRDVTQPVRTVEWAGRSKK